MSTEKALDTLEILANSSIRVAPETFALVSLSKAVWIELLKDPSRSPRMEAPFMILIDHHEVTLLLDQIDLENVSPGLRDARIERGFRMLTFETPLDFEVVGFIARVSAILADANVPIIPISAFSRDHLLIRQRDLAGALNALRPHVKDLC